MGSNLSRITYPCCKWSADGDGFDLVEAKFGQERLTIDEVLGIKIIQEGL